MILEDYFGLIVCNLFIQVFHLLMSLHLHLLNHVVLIIIVLFFDSLIVIP